MDAWIISGLVTAALATSGLLFTISLMIANERIRSRYEDEDDLDG